MYGKISQSVEAKFMVESKLPRLYTVGKSRCISATVVLQRHW